MMKVNIQAEWLKEKRSVNRKMLFWAPLIFMFFCFLLTLLMGSQSNGQSCLTASAFNWYPLIILPIILAFMVANSFFKEKQQQLTFYQSHGFSLRNLYFGKVVVIIFHLVIILAFSSLLFCFLSYLVFQDHESLGRILLTFFALFCGSLPILALCFLLVMFFGRIPMLLLTFICSQGAAIVAAGSWWFLYPWCYSLRMMAAVMRIHPNGLYITDMSSPLLDISNLWLGCIFSIVVFLVIIVGGGLLIVKRGGRK